MGKVNAMTYDNAVTAECRACLGSGKAAKSFGLCDQCNGSGEIRCDTGGLNCQFTYCYCEAVWDRQQEDYGIG